MRHQRTIYKATTNHVFLDIKQKLLRHQNKPVLGMSVLQNARQGFKMGFWVLGLLPFLDDVFVFSSSIHKGLFLGGWVRVLAVSHVGLAFLKLNFHWFFGRRGKIMSSPFKSNKGK